MGEDVPLQLVDAGLGVRLADEEVAVAAPLLGVLGALEGVVLARPRVGVRQEVLELAAVEAVGEAVSVLGQAGAGVVAVDLALAAEVD